MDILFAGSVVVHRQEKQLAALKVADPELYHAVRPPPALALAGVSSRLLTLRAPPPSQLEIGDRETIERLRGSPSASK